MFLDVVPFILSAQTIFFHRKISRQNMHFYSFNSNFHSQLNCIIFHWNILVFPVPRCNIVTEILERNSLFRLSCLFSALCVRGTLPIEYSPWNCVIKMELFHVCSRFSLFIYFFFSIEFAILVGRTKWRKNEWIEWNWMWTKEKRKEYKRKLKWWWPISVNYHWIFFFLFSLQLCHCSSESHNSLSVHRGRCIQ